MFYDDNDLTYIPATSWVGSFKFSCKKFWAGEKLVPGEFLRLAPLSTEQKVEPSAWRLRGSSRRVLQ